MALSIRLMTTRFICSGIDSHLRDAGANMFLELDIRKQAVIERQRLVEERMQVGRHRARRRHARKLRELVDQALERFDLAEDNRGRALLHEVMQRRFDAAQLAAEPSADSWIGVSGFLISCARRRATWRHAATFCARSTVSLTTNTAVERAVGAGDAGRRGHDMALAAGPAPLPAQYSGFARAPPNERVVNRRGQGGTISRGTADDAGA